MKLLKTFVSTQVVGMGLALVGCSAEGYGETDDEGVAVGVTEQALGEATCTDLPAPPVGQPQSNIANFDFSTQTHCPSQTYWSQGPNYSSFLCPRQYVFQVNDAQAPLLGITKSYLVQPVWGGPVLTSTTCPTARLNLTVWRWSGFPSPPQWLFPAVGQFTSTGHWEGGKCVFRRDDNGSADLSIPLVLQGYTTTFRAAAQSKRGSNFHSVGVKVDSDCPPR